MLQQTTVAAVIPYYERFLAVLPDVESLAAAPESTVLRLWEGLGYYSRARNLHAAAKQVVATDGGNFPHSVHEWKSLPGIGRYTAGAITSFAFDQSVPIVEANTLRLYSRLIGLQDDPKSTAGQRRLWSFAETIVPRKQAGNFNHALMDLGATICRPRDPQCDICPVRRNCVALANGQQHELPRLPARAAITDVTEAYLVVANKNRVLLRRRGENERWAGLWDFPRCELPPGSLADCSFSKSGKTDPVLPFDSGENVSIPRAIMRTLKQGLYEQTDIAAEILEPFTEIHHGVTRYRIRVICFNARYQSGVESSDTRWISPADLHEYPLSRSGRKLADFLTERASYTTRARFT